jgi:hypothetical protein
VLVTPRTLPPELAAWVVLLWLLWPWVVEVPLWLLFELDEQAATSTAATAAAISPAPLLLHHVFNVCSLPHLLLCQPTPSFASGGSDAATS